jgi:hypothetical protein
MLNGRWINFKENTKSGAIVKKRDKNSCPFYNGLPSSDNLQPVSAVGLINLKVQCWIKHMKEGLDD